MPWPFFPPKSELKFKTPAGGSIKVVSDDTAVAAGSTGTVCRAHDLQDVLYAIKFFRYVPQDLEGKPEQKYLGKIQEEATMLNACRHPNIVKVYGTGVWQPRAGMSIPFLAMEYVENGNILTYLGNTPLKAAGFLKLLRQICDALIYLHESREYMHADLRPQNILIRKNGDPVLVDFSIAKNFNFAEVGAHDTTRARELVRLPQWLPHDNPLKTSVAIDRETLKKHGFPWLDLYHFGLLLEDLREFWPTDFSVEEEKFLETLQWVLNSSAIRMRNQKGPDQEDAPAEWGARWLGQQLDKLLVDNCPLARVEELKTTIGKEMTQLPGQSIPVTGAMSRLINTKSFNRLRWLNQLSLVDAIYPGATHPRRMHAMRTYGLCLDLLRSLNHSAHFRFFFDEWLVKQASALALLHDINHYPFLHLLQEFENGPNHNEPIIDHFCNGILTEDGEDSIFNILQRELHLEPKIVRDILVLKYKELAKQPWVEPGHLIIKSMLDSGADIDKMAYLMDDSNFTGVRYGAGVDVGRLVASATVVRLPDATDEYDNRWHIGFKESGLPAVENLVMARLSMYRTVYWHHHNRAIMTMVRHVISTILDRLETDEARKSWFRAYLKDTRWRSEEGVLRYLDEQYSQEGPSMLSDLITTPNCIYERVLTIEGTAVTGRKSEEKDLYDALRRHRNNPRVIKLCREAVSEWLRVRIGLHKGAQAVIRDQDVLIDIPGRVLSWEEIYIAQDSGDKKGASLGIADLSEAMKALAEKKDPDEGMARMSCPVRVFVNPKLVGMISQKRVQEARGDLIKAIIKAIPGRNPSESH